jgi:hypothetical protein
VTPEEAEAAVDAHIRHCDACGHGIDLECVAGALAYTDMLESFDQESAKVAALNEQVIRTISAPDFGDIDEHGAGE